MYDYETTIVGEAPQLHIAAAAPQPAPIRRMPVKTRRVDLDGDYEGWWARVRTNAPFGLFLKLTNMGGDLGEDGTRAANAMGELLALLPQLVSEWNFVDTAGAPLPCDAAGMQQLPMELINALFAAISAGETVPKA
jgi:hypothetical protein